MPSISDDNSALAATRNDIHLLVEKIAILLSGVRARYGTVGDSLLREVVVALLSEAPEAPDDQSDASTASTMGTRHSGNTRPPQNDYVDNEKDSVTSFILSIAAANGGQLSVQHFVDALSEAGLEVSRPSLVVKLHRLVKSEKLFSSSTGHFRISETELARRQGSG